jgi:hypothetical protein
VSDYASEAGHWYDRDGTPRYTITDKNGKERNTTLRDARKHGWFPSFSAAEEYAFKPQLQNWITKHVLFTSEALPRREGEELEDWAKRVILASRQKRDEAPDRGSLIHGCIEKNLTGRSDYPKDYEPHVNGAKAALDSWCGLTNLGLEKSFAHPLGYGGKVDAHKPGFVNDWKTKEFTQDNLPDVWPNHFRQLAAYRHGLGMPTARCAITYISTSVPGLVHLVEVQQSDLEYGWESFRALLEIWKIEKNYRPEKGT